MLDYFDYDIKCNVTYEIAYADGIRHHQVYDWTQVCLCVCVCACVRVNFDQWNDNRLTMWYRNKTQIQKVYVTLWFLKFYEKKYI